MPPLKNLKHEKFARAVITSPSYTKAYETVYECTPDAARSSSSEVLAKPDVQNRILELMDRKGFTDEHLVERHLALMDGDNPSAAARLIELGYKVKGVLDESSNINVGVNININPDEREALIRTLKAVLIDE